MALGGNDHGVMVSGASVRQAIVSKISGAAEPASPRAQQISVFAASVTVALCRMVHNEPRCRLKCC